MEIFILLIGAGLYFIPTIVAYGKRNAAAICLLNIFLGWTFIGWVVALVWAASDQGPQHPAVPPSFDHYPKPPNTSSDEIIELVNMRNKGEISEDDFQREKQRITKS